MLELARRACQSCPRVPLSVSVQDATDLAPFLLNQRPDAKEQDVLEVAVRASKASAMPDLLSLRQGGKRRGGEKKKDADVGLGVF